MKTKAAIPLSVSTIISGGQTGAERGALDAAIEQGIPHGGICAKGRKSEDGQVPAKYQVTDASNEYSDRAEANVADACGTLICTFGRLGGASKQVWEHARKHGKPALHLDLNAEATDYAVKRVREWLSQHAIRVLNVAGSRESESAGLHGAVKDLLNRVFR